MGRPAGATQTSGMRNRVGDTWTRCATPTVSGNFRLQIRVMEFSQAALHDPSIQAVTAGDLVSTALFYNWAKISGSGRMMAPPVVRRMRSADSNHPWRLQTKARRSLGSMTQMLTTPKAR